MQNFGEIEMLWNEWKTLPFPSEVVGKEVLGICITSLDTFTAGCIDYFIENNGSINDQRRSILKSCHKDIENIIQNLDSESKAYFEKLFILSDKVLDFIEKKLK